MSPSPDASGHARSASGEIYFEVYGPPGAPALLSMNPGTSRGVFPEVNRGYRDGLAGDFRLVSWDYPACFGGSRAAEAAPPLSADQAAADYIAVADAAGADRFAYLGYSFGGNSGLQLAARHPERLTALIVGGWPALGGDFARMLAVTREMAAAHAGEDAAAGEHAIARDIVAQAMRGWVQYYESLQSWDEAAAARSCAMPRLNFADADDVTFGAEIGPSLIRHEAELQAMGWETKVVRTGAPQVQAHAAAFEPAVVIPIVREFLGRVL